MRGKDAGVWRLAALVWLLAVVGLSTADSSDDKSVVKISSDAAFSPQKNQVLQQGTAFATDLNGYSLSFWLKLSASSASSGWKNILHKGATNSDRCPGVYLYPDSTKLYVESNPAGTLTTSSLPVNKWIYVAITHGEGYFKIYANGVALASKSTAKPSWNSGKLWVSNPWYAAADCQLASMLFNSRVLQKDELIETAKLNTELASNIVVPETVVIPQADKITPVRGKQYLDASAFPWPLPQCTWSFWIKITNFVQSSWTNIFHRGTSNSMRVPGVYLYPGTTRLVIISSSSDNPMNNGLTLNDDNRILYGVWTHVAFSHNPDEGMKVYINAEKVAQVSVSPMMLDVGPLSISSDDFLPADVTLANLMMHTSVLSSSDIKTVMESRKDIMAEKAALPPPTLLAQDTPTWKPASQFRVATGLPLSELGYTYLFWIRPLGTLPQWSSVAQRGSSSSDRAPAIMLYPGTVRPYVFVATKKNPYKAIEMYTALDMYMWNHFALTANTTHLVLYWDGVMSSYEQISDLGGLTMTAGDVWASKFFDPSNCEISGFTYAQYGMSSEDVVTQMKLRPDLLAKQTGRDQQLSQLSDKIDNSSSVVDKDGVGLKEVKLSIEDLQMQLKQTQNTRVLLEQTVAGLRKSITDNDAVITALLNAVAVAQSTLTSTCQNSTDAMLSADDAATASLSSQFDTLASKIDGLLSTQRTAIMQNVVVKLGLTSSSASLQDAIAATSQNTTDFDLTNLFNSASQSLQDFSSALKTQDDKDSATRNLSNSTVQSWLASEAQNNQTALNFQAFMKSQFASLKANRSSSYDAMVGNINSTTAQLNKTASDIQDVQHLVVEKSKTSNAAIADSIATAMARQQQVATAIGDNVNKTIQQLEQMSTSAQNMKNDSEQVMYKLKQFPTKKKSEHPHDWTQVPIFCLNEVSLGDGSTSKLRYFFDYKTRPGTCKPFYYSGQGGNLNNFESKEDCELTCLTDDDDTSKLQDASNLIKLLNNALSIIDKFPQASSS